MARQHNGGPTLINQLSTLCRAPSTIMLLIAELIPEQYNAFIREMVCLQRTQFSPF